MKRVVTGKSKLKVLQNQQLMKASLVIPCFLIVFCVVIFPFLYSLIVSFTSQDLRLGLDWNFIGLKNYENVFNDNRALNAFKNTLIIGIPALFIELVFGLFLALLLNREFILRQLVTTLFVLPVAVPPLVVGFIWRTMLHGKYGLINDIIYKLGFAIRPEWLSTKSLAVLSVIAVDVWQWTPFVMLIIIAGLKHIDYDFFEAAMIDGAKKTQVFFSIIIPLVKRYIIVAALFRSAYLIILFDPIFILTFGGPSGVTETIGFYTYLVGFRFFRMGYAASLSYLLLIITIFISLALLRLQKEE